MTGNIQKLLFNMFIQQSFVDNINQDILEYCHRNAILDHVILQHKIPYKNRTPETIRKRETIRLLILKSFIEELKDSKIEYVFLKGLAMRKYYPSWVIRKSSDYDLLVRDINDFFVCYKILEGLGFNYEHYPIFTKLDHHILGTIKFIKIVDNFKIIIEVNIGGFSIGELTWIRDSSIWEEKEIFDKDNLKYYIPCDKHNLIIFLAEASGRRSHLLRDSIDFHYLYQSIDKYIFSNVNIKDVYLRYILKKFIYIEENRDNLENLTIKIINRRNLEFLHTIPNNLPFNTKKLLYYLFQKVGFRYSNNNKMQKIIKKIDDNISIKKRFESGIPTVFVPITDNNDSSGFTWIEKNGNHFVKTPIGIFIPSVFCIFYENEILQINEILKEGVI
jgi:hypothetical protein